MNIETIKTILNIIKEYWPLISGIILFLTPYISNYIKYKQNKFNEHKKYIQNAFNNCGYTPNVLSETYTIFSTLDRLKRNIQDIKSFNNKDNREFLYCFKYDENNKLYKWRFPDVISNYKNNFRNDVLIKKFNKLEKEIKILSSNTEIFKTKSSSSSSSYTPSTQIYQLKEINEKTKNKIINLIDSIIADLNNYKNIYDLDNHKSIKS